MLRTAIRPRWLALLLVVLLAATGMVLLGRWQLDRAREHGREPVERALRAQLRAAPVPLARVIKVRQTFPKDGVGVRVTIDGSWDDAHRLLVADRELGGRNGYWVLTPLRLADGSAVPVVRGWVPSPSDPAASTTSAGGSAPAGQVQEPAGQVQVIGLLEPSEPPVQLAPGQSSDLPADQLAQITATALVNRWTYPLITGFVIQQTQVPAAPAGLTRVPQPVPDSGLDLLNVFYAIQWWLFAGVALFFWWRLVRDDSLSDDHLSAGDLNPDHPGADHQGADHSSADHSSAHSEAQDVVDPDEDRSQAAEVGLPR